MEEPQRLLRLSAKKKWLFSLSVLSQNLNSLILLINFLSFGPNPLARVFIAPFPRRDNAYLFITRQPDKEAVSRPITRLKNKVFTGH
jgi:hypothetical protein